MEISYDEIEDILFIRFNHEPIIRDISYGWHGWYDNKGHWTNYHFGS